MDHRDSVLKNLTRIGVCLRNRAETWEYQHDSVRKQSKKDLDDVRTAWKFINAGHDSEKMLCVLRDRISPSIEKNTICRMVEILRGEGGDWFFDQDGRLTCV